MYLKKDSTVLDLTLLTCLKYWPKIDPYKEVNFIDEVETVILSSEVLIQSFGDHKLVSARHIITQVAKCCQSLHFSVAQRALMLLSTKHFQALIQTADDYIVCVDSLLCNISQPSDLSWLDLIQSSNKIVRVKHWNLEIRGMSYLALRQFSVILGPKVYT